MHGKRKIPSLKKAEINERKRVEAALREALEQQTATSEILRTISSSPTDLAPVFNTILANACRLCEANLAALWRYNGEVLVGEAHYNASPEFAEFFMKTPLQPGPQGPARKAALERRTIHVTDILTEPGFSPKVLQFERARTVLTVPLLRENALVGVIAMWRREVRAFTEQQVTLVRTFADQAVIAIENVRLFQELQARNRDLTEALEQQSATSEILRVISSSLTDLQPVLDAVAESAARLCDANDAYIQRIDGDVLRVVAHYGPIPARLTGEGMRISRGSVAGRAVVDQHTIHVHDLGAEPETEFPVGKAYQQRFGHRTILATPLLREGTPVGVITIRRMKVRPFSDKQIELVTTFADQAVIAIENARLFREIEEKTRHIEIASKHKSQFLANMSHELRTPLSAIIGFTELVMTHSKDVLPGRQYANLERILMNAQHLLSLINEILDLSKIEAGRIEIHPAEFALEPLVDLCLRTVEPLIKSDRLRLVKEIEPNLPMLFTDEDRLKQILINLLSNAVKFTRDGAVTVTGRCQNREIVLAVQDTGIGIPEEALGQIFEEFHQVDSSSTRQYGGTGLGLAITRHLTQLLGGDITVQSRVGAGSTFTVRLPQRYAAGEAEEPAGRATEGCESRRKEGG